MIRIATVVGSLLSSALDMIHADKTDRQVPYMPFPWDHDEC